MSALTHVEIVCDRCETSTWQRGGSIREAREEARVKEGWSTGLRSVSARLNRCSATGDLCDRCKKLPKEPTP